MGYTTDFKGSLSFSKNLTKAQVKTINDFCHSRHDTPGYPGIWCDWEVCSNSLQHNGGEKFYNYVEWLQYLIDNYFSKWGVLLNGEMAWSGEDSEDRGVIIVENNDVEARDDMGYMADLESALDHVLKLSKDKLPLFMGINEVLDNKIKNLMSARMSIG